MTFTLDLQKFAEKAKERADDAVSGVVTAIVAKVDARSPVGNPSLWKHDPPAGYVGGHFRANWQLGIDRVPAGELAGVDPTGAETTGRNFAIIPAEAAGHVYTLSNNLPYAMRLEHGYSTQSPAGMVGLTVVEFQDIVDAAVREAAI